MSHHDTPTPQATGEAAGTATGPTAASEQKRDCCCRHHHHHKHHHCGKRLLFGLLAVVGIVALLGFAFGGHSRNRDSGTERATQAVEHLFDKVDATPAQLERAKAIVAAHAPTLNSLGNTGEQLRIQARSLLIAPTIDRAALESLRQQHVQTMEQNSREISAMLADLAGVLTAKQRTELADALQKSFEHHPGHWLD